MEQTERVGISNKSSPAAIGLLAVALIVLAKYAQDVLLPVAVAIVLTFLFSPLVRRLRRYGIPDAIGAAVVVSAFVTGLIVVASVLAAPAAAWWDRAPQGIQQLIDRAEQWRRSMPFLAPAPTPAAPVRTTGRTRVPENARRRRPIRSRTRARVKAWP
jgi:predicted PurR-regulated permease PerM